MNAGRIVIAIAAGVGMLATFLPWASLGMLSIPGSKGDGWITFVLFAGCLGAALAGDRKRQPDIAWLKWSGAAFAAGAVAVAAWKIIALKSGLDDSNPFSSAVAVGVGLWLIVPCGIGCLVGLLGPIGRTSGESG